MTEVIVLSSPERSHLPSYILSHILYSVHGRIFIRTFEVHLLPSVGICTKITTVLWTEFVIYAKSVLLTFIRGLNEWQPGIMLSSLFLGSLKMQEQQNNRVKLSRNGSASLRCYNGRPSVSFDSTWTIPVTAVQVWGMQNKRVWLYNVLVRLARFDSARRDRLGSVLTDYVMWVAEKGN